VTDARIPTEAARHEMWRDGLARVLAAVLAGRDHCEALAEVAGAARTLAAADLALVIGPRRGRPTPGVLAGDGPAAGRLVGLPARRRQLPCGLLADVWRDPPVSRMPRMGPAIVVPVSVQAAAVETLWVLNAPRRPPFDEAMLALVRRLGEHAAGVLEASPRLHEDVVQTLFGIGMEVQAAAQLAGDGDLGARLQGTAENLDRLMERLRAHERGPAP
jgi:hypothetical protein